MPLNATLPASDSTPASPPRADADDTSSATGGSCPQCGAGEFYNARYDASFCPACNCWLESVCSDRGCRYCHQRPARPTATFIIAANNCGVSSDSAP
ncbi:MAG: hypothetical protein PCFJNLEI_03297 [Verrucomicrobiae bacterium]|nr:hypothetical protein [Verrucomicrobiae bacterium]